MKTRLFFLFIALAFFAQAQQIKFSGIVQDSLAKPLEAASLVAINKASNALDAYALTDEKGAFFLKLKTNTAYKIQVSALGLQTINESLITAQSDLSRDYELRADIVLDEVVVKMPVLIDQFCILLKEHEKITAAFLNQSPVQERLFPDFDGQIKSLGAWGGDFVLAAGNKNVKAYFEKKGYPTVISYANFILG